MSAAQPAGIGLGFRFQHAPAILRDKPKVPWFELIADDLLLSSGRQRVIDKLRAHYPISLHAVGLNIGGPAPLNDEYISALATVYQTTDAAWLSDHLCWSATDTRQHFDLLPLPFTEEMLDYLCPRIHRVQERLNTPLVLENISYYQRFRHDEMSEWEFTAALMQRTGCKMLLDLNNLWTNASNFDQCPDTALSQLMSQISADDIVQIHVAGSKYHASQGTTEPGYWVDTHGEPVPEAVVDLLKTTFQHYGDIPTIIERDNNLPEFAELAQERTALIGALLNHRGKVS